jgi:putative transposase
MPLRITPLVTGEYYHVFNRGINKQLIFLALRDYKRALCILEYYSYVTSIRWSKFLMLSIAQRGVVWEKIKQENKKRVNIICYCFMPNHFHFMLEQVVDNGISRFMSDFQNSYTRYFNTKRKGVGPLLQGQFKAVRIEDDSQLLHLSRYIHLNPYTSFVVKEESDLLRFSWSSLQEYLNNVNTGICNKEVILSQFKSTGEYGSFVFDRVAYQRELRYLRHMILDD